MYWYRMTNSKSNWIAYGSLVYFIINDKNKHLFINHYLIIIYYFR